MGWRIALPVAVGAFGGLLLDNKFHTKPLIALIGLGIGTFISFRLVYKLFKQFAEEQKNIDAIVRNPITTFVQALWNNWVGSHIPDDLPNNPIVKR